MIALDRGIARLVLHGANLLAMRESRSDRHSQLGAGMLNIIAVCTGNICRSPLAEILLESHLADLDVRLSSAGTRARDGMGVTPETAGIALSLGAPKARIERHRARFLTKDVLGSADLGLALSREHRRQIVEMDPTFMRKTFTVRELARLLDDISNEELLGAAASAADTSAPNSRFSAMLRVVASRRGTVIPPAAEDDDVIDPYRRSPRTYELSAAQLTAALPAVERLARLAFAL